MTIKYREKSHIMSVAAVVMVLILAVTSVALPASAYVAPKQGTISYNKRIIDKYSEAAEDIINGMKNYEKIIDLSKYKIVSDDIGSIVFSAQLSRPELFYVALNFNYYYYDGYVTGIAPKYSYSKAIADQMLFQINDVANTYLKKLDSSMTDFQKAVILHDDIVLNCEYVYSGDNVTNLYGALVEGQALCQGYTAAYVYLLSLAGINTEIVESEDMQHMWVKAQIDGAWYNIDVTMDDPLMNGYDAAGFVYHDFFLISDAKIKNMPDSYQNHYGFDDAYYKCTSTKYDNYLYHEVDTQFCFVNGNCYIIDNKYQSTYEKYMLKYDYKTNKATTVKNIGGRWPSGTNRYWNGGFMSLYEYNGRLYYNTVNTIVCYDIASGKESVYYNGGSSAEFFGMVIDGRNVYVDKRASLLVASNLVYVGQLEYIPEPTTVAPTTAKPTVAPTTAKPTTAPPTTVKPTTAPPTTAPPTTTPPTTAKPTTVPPTTVAPTTVPPTTAQPTTSSRPIIIVKGDVNLDGIIGIDDATIVQKVLADSVKLDDIQFLAADYNSDGQITIDDATLIQKFIATT